MIRLFDDRQLRHAPAHEFFNGTLAAHADTPDRADPASDFPYFWDHADETGSGTGTGANRNLILPRGTGWTGYVPALDSALESVARHGTDLLVLSFGADTFAGDPIAGFALETPDFATMGRHIAAAGLHTVIVMEGGYAVDALGANVAALLSSF